MSAQIPALHPAFLPPLPADADPAAHMGGACPLYRGPPRAAEPVYAVFGAASARDWSADGAQGHEHDIAIVAWAKSGSARSALLAAERMAGLLHDAALAPAGHRLVLIRVTAIESDRDEKANLARATLRLRALTEAA